MRGKVTRKRQHVGRVGLGMGLLLLVGVAALPALSGCSDQAGSSPSEPPSPQPAASVAVLPGLSAADAAQKPGKFRHVARRVINVYIKDGSSRRQRRDLAERIAAMPEVIAYHYVTKTEALKRFAATSRRFAEVAEGLAVNPLPASFEILVTEGADVRSVARRFRDEPLIDGDPDGRFGVAIGAKTPLPPESASP